MSAKLAVVVSHPIQHFAPWHREVAKLKDIDLRVFFCSRLGLDEYVDGEFKVSVKWDIPLLEGYSYEFLPVVNQPKRVAFWEIDNPHVSEALNRFGPDVVKIFGYHLRTNWRVVFWANPRNIPIMLYSDSQASRRRAFWKRAAKSVVVRSFYRRVDAALYVGEDNREYHRYYGIPDDRLYPGTLPIDKCRLVSFGDAKASRVQLRRHLGIPEDAFVALFSGKFAPHKSALHLVRAMHASNRAGSPVWALLVGDGQERAAAEEFCRTNNVTNVVFTGFVNQSSIGRYYAASDLLVVSSFRDAHPLVVPEAGCFGLPVVASNRIGCIGASDTVRPDVNAIVYPWGDIGALNANIERLRTDGPLYARMSKAARDVAETQDVKACAQLLRTAALRLREAGVRQPPGVGAAA